MMIDERYLIKPGALGGTPWVEPRPEPPEPVRDFLELVPPDHAPKIVEPLVTVPAPVVVPIKRAKPLRFETLISDNRGDHALFFLRDSSGWWVSLRYRFDASSYDYQSMTTHYSEAFTEARILELAQAMKAGHWCKVGAMYTNRSGELEYSGSKDETLWLRRDHKCRKKIINIRESIKANAELTLEYIAA